MNRIILIGNGFDLAHGLKTSYKDFLNNYWQEWYKLLSTCKGCQVSDELYHFDLRIGAELATGSEIGYLSYLLNTHIIHNRTWQQWIDGDHLEIKTFQDITDYCNAINQHREIENSQHRIHHEATSQLFNVINKAYLSNWVDIENEYYKLLKRTCFGENNTTPNELNTDLKHIENKLIKYLSKIQNDQINSGLLCKQITEKIFQPFNINDISVGGRQAFFQSMNKRFDDANEDAKVYALLRRYGHHDALSAQKELHYIKSYLKQAEDQTLNNHEFHEKRIIQGNSNLVPKYFLMPEDILFLNFNYTNTASLYNPNHCQFTMNHIHGEMDNPNNPIIFGYGDEMDDDYKEIKKLNDNSYLENFKSIRYLETDNYRKLLSFINSGPYQLTIMGHSCGNSDRTLLNTLFEHENCISIKPYYHQKEDGSDNYIDIVQNISRDFNDMTLMRDRVVNKGYCEPLPQNK